MMKIKSNVLLIGEAPGYKGCRLTGIPFTSRIIIKNTRHKIFEEIGDRIKLHHVISENTATILWNFLKDNKKPAPILWNTFPFHPHLPGKDESNRKPYSREIEEGKKYLKIIYDLFKPEKIGAIGKTAEKVVKNLFPYRKTFYIRHPSHGGKQKFIEGMLKLYDKR